MTEQLALTGDAMKISLDHPPAAKPRRRQQFALDYIRDHDGVTADDLRSRVVA